MHRRISGGILHVIDLVDFCEEASATNSIVTHLYKFWSLRYFCSSIRDVPENGR